MLPRPTARRRAARATLLLALLTACRPEANVPPDARYQTSLHALSTADQQDRQAIFRVFRRYGFQSAQADSANRWLLARDSARFAAFEALERQYGWPRPPRFDQASLNAAFLLVQHAAQPEARRRRLPLMTAAYQRSQLSGQNYAAFVDRVLTEAGHGQRYGTQSTRHARPDGREATVLLPIDSLSGLDQRRRRLGLGPLLRLLKPHSREVKAGLEDSI